jgi:hypothetical protein
MEADPERENGMARIEGEIVIGRPVDVVFDYVADQSNEPQYNPHMVRADKITPGPEGKGTWKPHRQGSAKAGPASAPSGHQRTGSGRPGRRGRQ